MLGDGEHNVVVLVFGDGDEGGFWGFCGLVSLWRRVYCGGDGGKGTCGVFVPSRRGPLSLNQPGGRGREHLGDRRRRAPEMTEGVGVLGRAWDEGWALSWRQCRRKGSEVCWVGGRWWVGEWEVV